MAFFELKSHDYLQHLVEFVGGEAFDVFGAGIEVASDVGEYGEVGIDRGGVTFEDFKIHFAGSKPSRIRSSSVMA